MSSLSPVLLIGQNSLAPAASDWPRLFAENNVYTSNDSEIIKFNNGNRSTIPQHCGIQHNVCNTDLYV